MTDYKEGIPVFSAKQTRALDTMAIEQGGTPGFDLMSLAGRAAFRVLRQCWPQCESIVVVCGGGNNGGDGYIIAGLAQMQGMSVRCLYLVPPETLSGDAHQAYLWAQDKGVNPHPWDALECGAVNDSEVIVDALLGTGLSGDVRSPFKEVIGALNRWDNVFSVDIPSGLCADTGNILGACVKAKVTVTFIGRKAGLYTAFGPEVAGQVFFADLKVPGWVYQKVSPMARLTTPESVLSRWPYRANTTHKGDCGRVVVVGGDDGMSGALLMASSAVLRTGAGLVWGATRSVHAHQLVNARPEVMFRGVEGASQVIELLTSASGVVIGPGLGQNAWGHEMVEAVLSRFSQQNTCFKLILDADALNILAEKQGRRRGKPEGMMEDIVLTPHPGEAARLLDCSISQVSDDRFGAAREISTRYHSVVVLKGAGTIVADFRDANSPAGFWVNTTGNAGMATAGMGDVLSGIIGALLGQNLSALNAALCGVAIHGASADLCVEHMGRASLLASDVIDGLKRVTRQIDHQTLDWRVDY